jgi:hypothetical protein
MPRTPRRRRDGSSYEAAVERGRSRNGGHVDVEIQLEIQFTRWNALAPGL